MEAESVVNTLGQYAPGSLIPFKNHHVFYAQLLGFYSRCQARRLALSSYMKFRSE